MKPRVLGQRALNRALLARQLLLARAPLAPLVALDRLVGLQAQVPGDPYVGLWSRLEDFDPKDLSAMIADRMAVRLSLMRCTLHLVSRSDGVALRPVIQSVVERSFEQTRGRRLPAGERAAVLAAGRALVEARPRTLAELRVELGARWPARDADAMAYWIHAAGALVQVPPRGLWRTAGPATCTTVESWLRQPLASDASPDRMIVRYLTAFGPATVADVQAWSGLRPLGDALERLRPRLRTFADDHGRTLHDVRCGLLPDPGTPAPPRFLPGYDNALLGHADRSRIIDDAHRRSFMTANGIGTPTFLVDGFVAGAWRIARTPRRATLVIEPVVTLRARDRAAVAAEGERLLGFLAGDAAARTVSFTARRIPRSRRR